MKKIYILFFHTFWILNMLSGQNLIINPSAETNPTSNGWTQVSGNWQQRSVSPNPQDGASYFFAGANSNAELYQDIDVSSHSTTIDQGNQDFTFSGYTSSWPSQGVDDSRLIVEYRNLGGTILDSYDTGWSQSTSWIQHSDTRTAPIGTRIIKIRILANRDSGSNNDGYTDNLSLIAENSLPVELSNFNVNNTENAIQLTWETTSELNNQGFEVQRSQNGDDWEKIGFVDGNGTTTETNKYIYNDFVPLPNMNYYRLKQIDFDGIFEYSSVVSAKHDVPEKNIRIFPNPSNGLINIQIDNPANQNIEIWITNNLGMKVWAGRINGGESNWMNEMKIKESGIYFVSIQTGNQIDNRTILITD